MTLADIRKAYAERSKSTSDVSRQLGFAGLGLVWIMRTGDGGLDAIPGVLLLPAALLILGLGLDLAQAVLSTAIWGAYQGYITRKGVPEELDFRAPRWFNWPAVICFWGKLVAISWAYVLMTRFLWKAV
ncbi:MAG: hypothetical protein AB1625_12795 [Acidobacteriota bacterium]